MPAPTTFPGDVTVRGSLSATRFSPPAGSIGNTGIKAGAAGDFIAASKVRHEYRAYHRQAIGTNCAALTEVLAQIKGDTATVTDVEVTILGQLPTTDRSVTVDIQRSTGGGAPATILTGTLTVNNGSAVLRVAEIASIDGTKDDLVVGDYLYAVVTVAGSSGDHAQGLLVTVVWVEDPQY